MADTRAHRGPHPQDARLFAPDKIGSFAILRRSTSVPVASGEKVFIGPMPLMLQVEAQEAAVVVEERDRHLQLGVDRTDRPDVRVVFQQDPRVLVSGHAELFERSHEALRAEIERISTTDS